MGSKKNVDMTQTESDVKKIELEEKVTDQEQETEKKTKKVSDKKSKSKPSVKSKASAKSKTASKKDKTEEEVEEKDSAEAKKTQKKNKSKKVLGKKYQAVRAQLDKTKTYSPEKAISLVKKFSYAKFDASIDAHIVVKEVGTSTDLTLPHSTGKDVKVVIANDKVLADIEKGEIDFDVLLAKPELMPKLAKLARILGPKGLMPNPKNGTLTPQPEVKKKEIEAGAFTLKTEKKAPLMHLVIGKVSMDDKQLKENLMTVIKSLKNKLVKLAIAPSMGPAIKVDCKLEEEK
jgi:large subunit ribosomal protein L1